MKKETDLFISNFQSASCLSFQFRECTQLEYIRRWPLSAKESVAMSRSEHENVVIQYSRQKVEILILRMALQDENIDPIMDNMD